MKKIFDGSTFLKMLYNALVILIYVYNYLKIFMHIIFRHVFYVS